MLTGSDKKSIDLFMRGFSLPYNDYPADKTKELCSYKKNNLEAAVHVLKGIRDYENEKRTPDDAEILTALLSEVVVFSLNGLFGIGFYGISVENGVPVRVDSLGKNVSKQYKSVYEGMSEEEYVSLDRIDSMILDQTEERKFKKQVSQAKYDLRETLAHRIEQERDSTEHSGFCMDIDALFLDFIRLSGITSVGRGHVPYIVATALGVTDKMLERYNKWKERLPEESA